MAKNFQMQKKNEDGTLEIVHPETNSSVVKHGDKNVDEVLDAKLPYIQSVEITYGTNLVSLTSLLSPSGNFYGVVKFSGLFDGHYFCDLNVTGGISYITDTKTGAVYSNQTNNNNTILIQALLTNQYKVNNLKTINGQSLIGNGDISIKPPIFEQFDGGTFVLQDTVLLDTSGYNDIIIILEEVAGVDQPSTNIVVANSISLSPIPLPYSTGTPFIVRLERLNTIDFLLTATGGCVPTTGIITDSGDGIELWFENGTESEEYAFSFYGK